MINRFIPMRIPRTTHQQKRVNFQTGQFYEDSKLSSAREQFLWALKAYAPAEPLEPPIYLRVFWKFYTKDKKKRNKFKTTRPDLDNHQKLLQDCMTRLGYWQDDSQIAHLVIKKLWSDVEGIAIECYTMKEGIEE